MGQLGVNWWVNWRGGVSRWVNLGVSRCVLWLAGGSTMGLAGGSSEGLKKIYVNFCFHIKNYYDTLLQKNSMIYIPIFWYVGGGNIPPPIDQQHSGRVFFK